MEKPAYEVIQIDETSWRIEENGVRSFLFAGQEFALLVDSGFGTGDLKAVTDSLTTLPIMLVNTHADGDHTGCNAQFGEAHLHPAELDRYEAKCGTPAPARPLWEGDVIDLGNRRFEVILIPGHTPGSIALLDSENRILISGDSAVIGHIFMFGDGRNLSAYAASMEKLHALRSRFYTVYPSHGDFPLKSAVVGKLAAGARQILAMQVPGREVTFMDQKVRLYPVGKTNFLCAP